MDSSHRISLLDIGLVIEKLIGNGYLSEYCKREFKTKYNKYIMKKVTTITKLSILYRLKNVPINFTTFSLSPKEH